MVRKARGSASEFSCDGYCGKQAEDWATIHDRDGLDPSDYVPLCKKCHWHYDHDENWTWLVDLPLSRTMYDYISFYGLSLRVTENRGKSSKKVPVSRRFV
jgi:hypothetical protein